MKLLHIDSSILGENSVSRTVSAAIVKRLVEADGTIEVTRRDLAAQPISHLSGAYLAGASADVKHDQALQEDVTLGGAALAEFLATDIVVLGVPMYNLSIPSQLKAWFDRIIVAGKTFHYTEKGAEGLAGGKQVFVASSRGGFYGEGTPRASFDHQETLVRDYFGFIGIPDIKIISAEGVAMGPEQREKSLAAALELVGQIKLRG